jgi:hypothetical protein
MKNVQEHTIPLFSMSASIVRSLTIFFIAYYHGHLDRPIWTQGNRPIQRQHECRRRSCHPLPSLGDLRRLLGAVSWALTLINVSRFAEHGDEASCEFGVANRHRALLHGSGTQLYRQVLL